MAVKFVFYIILDLTKNSAQYNKTLSSERLAAAVSDATL